MRHAVLQFCIMLSYFSSGQTTRIDTIHATGIISTVDSLELSSPRLRDVIVPRLEHEQTKFYYEFLVDTATVQIFRYEYLTLTINGNDSLLERTTFYAHDSDFVAVIFREYRNNKKLDSALVYLECEKGWVTYIHPKENNGRLTEEAIKFLAAAVWRRGEQLKEWFRKKNGG